MFQNSTGAGKDLFLDQITDEWPLLYETGHTYQAVQYKWNDLTEVSNNLSGDLFSWTKLGMLWQLQMGFGNNFYPLLNEIYRQINNGKDSESMFRFNTDYKKIQMFIKINSYATDYNLGQFFNEWGIKLTTETDNIISKYKPLTKPIWNNIADLITEFNPIIQEMVSFELVETE